MSQRHTLGHGLGTDCQFCGEHILEDLRLFIAVMHVFDNVNTLLRCVSDVNDISANRPWQLCSSVEQPPEFINLVCRKVVDRQCSRHGQEFLVFHYLFGQGFSGALVVEHERQHWRLG